MYFLKVFLPSVRFLYIISFFSLSQNFNRKVYYYVDAEAEVHSCLSIPHFWLSLKTTLYNFAIFFFYWEVGKKCHTETRFNLSEAKMRSCNPRLLMNDQVSFFFHRRFGYFHSFLVFLRI